MYWLKSRHRTKTEIQNPVCITVTSYPAESFTSANGVTQPKGTLQKKNNNTEATASESFLIPDYSIISTRFQSNQGVVQTY